jgi:hypothetical protein
MADYSAIVEAGNSLVEILRDNLSPEPVGNRELISLCCPHESENNQLTVYLFHVEEDMQNTQAGYYAQSADTERIRPSLFRLSFLITSHSKAPVQVREADQYRVIGAVLQTLKDTPTVPARYLQGSLADSGADLHLSVERPNYEQMMKIWNNTTARYKLSVVCNLSGVTIDSKRLRRISRVKDVELNLEEKP